MAALIGLSRLWQGVRLARLRQPAPPRPHQRAALGHRRDVCAVALSKPGTRGGPARAPDRFLGLFFLGVASGFLGEYRPFRRPTFGPRGTVGATRRRPSAPALRYSYWHGGVHPSWTCVKC